jgi:hypothetical protein
MRCEAVRRSLSEAMDERRTVPPDVDSHTRTCTACATFERSAWRLRELSRFEVAPAVPDLVPAIMGRIRSEATGHATPIRPGGGASSWEWLASPRAAAVALVVGLVVGLVVTSGGVIPREPSTTALAQEIPEQLVQAAVELRGYRATFHITELNWTPEVRRRTFIADLSFDAPETFRVEVRDTSAYPSRQWPRNDLLLETDGRTWRIRGPDPCPSGALPDCPRTEPVERVVYNRPPFDSRTAMPTDVVVPMTVLAAADRVEVIGSGLVGDRDAVAVALAYEDATPLFDYLRFLGSWRPFYPRDRVVVWLDRQTWFPLRYQVFAAAGAERALWAAQQALPPGEGPATPLLTATATSLDASAPPGAPPAAASPPAGPLTGAALDAERDLGFMETGTPVSSSLALLQPADTADLLSWRSGRFERSPSRPYAESIKAFARGLSWLTVTRIEGWSQGRPFGVGPFAEPVVLPGGGETGLYEPASSAAPRRVALHTRDGEFVVATNLPRNTLLRVASSLPVTGIRVPASWQVRRSATGVVTSGLSPEAVLANAGFEVLLPRYLPESYEPASAATVESASASGVTLVYRRPAAELDGIGLRLHQARGEELAPPSGGGQQAVVVGTVVGRWSPEEHLLEWMDGGIYRSLLGPALDLTTLVRVAESLAPPGALR